jgi:hypothetical protein
VFLNITGKVLSGGEQGLLGLAFHPQYPANPTFYVDYTRASDGATVIAMYHVSNDPNVASPAETVLLVIGQPFANHNGGMLAFGPDGYLYIGMGDGGSAFDPDNRAQNIDGLLGKILRIDVDHSNGPALYSSPATNPFYGPTPGADEIFAYGLRNPWRFSFDRATGALYVGDVGQNQREEVDVVSVGGNYGWRSWEGTLCTGLSPDTGCTGAGKIFPIAEYTHDLGRCSITGGYVYRGPSASLPAGSYVFGDFCTGEIFLLVNGLVSRILDTTLGISSFGEDEAGEIYVVDLNGSIYRIVGHTAVRGGDFDGDGKTDITVYRPSTGAWYIRASTAGFSSVAWGAPGDTPVPADYDGDGKTDIAVYRPNTGTWYILRSTAGFATVGWGAPGDIPVAADYDGDGKTDIAVYRPTTGTWYILRSSNSTLFTVAWGAVGDVPVGGDYDGDGKSDIAVYRPSTGTWYILRSSAGFATVQWGGSGDLPVSADFDGDGKTDIGVFRPSTGTWYILASTLGFSTVQWGGIGDLPVPSVP